MPFPAASLPVSFAIGIPISLAAFAAQEAILRRRAARRAGKPPVGTPAEPAAGADSGADVTTTPAAVSSPPMARARPARKAPLKAAAAPKAVAARKAIAAPKAAAAAQVAAAPKRAAPQTARAAPGRAPAAPRAGRAGAAALSKKRAGLSQGLEAIITFVDGPTRRANAGVCADALLLAIPRAQRGPAIEAFLHAVGAKLPPSRLQELAEDAGMEVATTIKQVAVEIASLPPG